MDNDRLTLTVEEAEQLPGPRLRARPRGELPHVRLGRRIVVRRRALDDLLDVGSLESA